jgi:hypothetical protein
VNPDDVLRLTSIVKICQLPTEVTRALTRILVEGGNLLFWPTYRWDSSNNTYKPCLAFDHRNHWHGAVDVEGITPEKVVDVLHEIHAHAVAEKIKSFLQENPLLS